MHHLKRHEEQLELEIFVEPVLKKKHCLTIPWAISFFEIVLIFFYLEYGYPIPNLKVVQVKHLIKQLQELGILMFCLFNIKPLKVNSQK